MDNQTELEEELLTYKSWSARWKKTPKGLRDAIAPGGCLEGKINPVVLGPRSIRFRLSEIVAVEREMSQPEPLNS